MHYQATGYTIKPFGNHVAQEIEKARYDSIKESKRVCILALGFEERLQLVLDNFHDWETELLEQAHRNLLWKTGNHGEAMQERLSLDRHMVNLLTSLRLYIDQTDHGLSELFGNPSTELESIKIFRSKLYDQNLGYRFLEALRNHVQHCGLPIHIISYNQALVEQPKGANLSQVTVAPKINIEELAANGGFKKTVLAELRKLGIKQLDARPFTREYISCLNIIHKEIQSTIKSRFEKAKQIYETTVAEFSVIDGQSIQLPRIICSNANGQIHETVELTTNFLRYHSELIGRNSKVEDIRTVFVSSKSEAK